MLATDEGNERAAERFLSQPILDSYGREVVHSYVLQEYRPNDYTQASVDLGLRGAVLRINSIADGVRASETLIFFDGIDQDLLHFQTSFNEGHLRFAFADDDARRQLRFIVSNNGTVVTIWMKRMLTAFRSAARCWVTGSMTPSPACRNSSSPDRWRWR